MRRTLVDFAFDPFSGVSLASEVSLLSRGDLLVVLSSEAAYRLPFPCAMFSSQHLLCLTGSPFAEINTKIWNIYVTRIQMSSALILLARTASLLAVLNPTRILVISKVTTGSATLILFVEVQNASQATTHKITHGTYNRQQNAGVVRCNSISR